VYDDDPGPASMPAVVFPLWAAGFEPYGWHRIRDAEELTDKALSFVLAQEKRAWFMMVHYADALGPYLTAADREAAGLSSTPGRAEAYPVALAKIDHNIDRLLSALPRDAIVVVMGDHGVQLDESRRQVGDAATGLWYGHTMYQELLHVPLVIHVPGSEGGRVTRPVSTLDVMPTLLGLAHVQHDLQLEGAPLVELSGGEVDRSRVLLAEGIRWGAEQQAARSGKHKAIARAGAKVSLFDLEDDPNESRPLIWSDGENQMVQKRLQAAMPHVGASRMGSEAPTMAQELGELLDRIAGAPR
jgi:choline-sulfatase